MLLGMTATRNPLTKYQLAWLEQVMAQRPQLHHGACVNGDEAGHAAAIMSGSVIVIHPPVDEKLMMPRWKFAQRACIYVMPAKPYWDRNHDIVDDTDRLIALPDGPEKPKGGTWGTVRYALANNKGVTICYPNGRIEDRLPSLTDTWSQDVACHDCNKAMPPGDADYPFASPHHEIALCPACTDRRWP